MFEHIYDVKQIEKYLLDIPRFSKKTSLDNIGIILDKLNHPENDMKVIHIAGTNGKGSVCAYLTSILIKAGKSVGTFVSPHLVKINERIKFCNMDISDDELVVCFNEAMDCLRELNDKEDEGCEHPSFFEMLYIIALIFFKRHRCEYIILETGLGGRLDATNSVKKPIITVITSISMDHMEILGDTLIKIAGEKAGIIKEGVTLIYSADNDEVNEVLLNTANMLNSKAIPVRKGDILQKEKTKKYIDFSFKNRYDEYGMIRVPFIAEYQLVNAMLAFCTACELGLSHENILDGIKDMKWEARMEEVCDKVYIDGAHNEDGVRAFIETVMDKDFNSYIKGRKILMYSSVKDKDYKEIIQRICKDTDFDEFYIAPLDSYRALLKGDLHDEFIKYVDESRIHLFDGTRECLDSALCAKNEDDVLFCAGSLYLAGEIKSHLNAKKGIKND